MIQILTGTALLLVVLALFTLFSYKAPHGMKAMGALANAACASFLVEAFHASLFGTQMGISFLQGVGDASGSLGGVAAGILVPLALGVSPAYAVLVGLTVSGFGILPGFIAGYLKSNSYEEALRLGAASGGATAFSSDLATREFIDKLVDEIKIEKIK